MLLTFLRFQLVQSLSSLLNRSTSVVEEIVLEVIYRLLEVDQLCVLHRRVESLADLSSTLGCKNNATTLAFL